LLSRKRKKATSEFTSKDSIDYKVRIIFYIKVRMKV